MCTNTLKQKPDSGQVVFGAMIAVPGPSVVEMLGRMGFGWVLIDNERGANTMDTVAYWQ